VLPVGLYNQTLDHLPDALQFGCSRSL